MLGYIFALVLGYGAGRIASSSSSSRAPEASRWSGIVGATPLQVWRNGPTWAWSAPNGSGADATVVGALRSAVRFVLESGAAQNGDGVELKREDNRVAARVLPAAGPGDRWRFVIETITPPVVYLTPSSTGTDIDTRGAALVQMFDRLGKYAEA